MTPEAFEAAIRAIKKLPGIGHRSAERIALYLLVQKTDQLRELVDQLELASQSVSSCPYTGNLCESGGICPIYADSNRDKKTVCVVESVTDLLAMERAGSFRGTYHVLHGKLSPLKGVGPEVLHFESLSYRIREDAVEEIILAVSNDIEGEATCHYIQEHILGDTQVKVSRIGFGLPSGSGVQFADPATLQSALEARRAY